MMQLSFKLVAPEYYEGPTPPGVMPKGYTASPEESWLTITHCYQCGRPGTLVLCDDCHAKFVDGKNQRTYDKPQTRK